MAGFGIGGKIEKNWFHGTGGTYVSYVIQARNANTCSITKPATITTGNLLMLFLTRQSGSVGSPSGWTTLSSAAHWNSNAGYTYIGYKRAGTEPASYSFNASGGIIVNFTKPKEIYSVSPFVKVTGSTTLNLYGAMGDQCLYFVATRNRSTIVSQRSELGYQYYATNSYFTYGFCTYPGSLTNSFTRNLTTNEFVGVSIGLV